MGQVLKVSCSAVCGILLTALLPAAHAAEGTLTLVYGPASADAARQGARAGASAARQWWKSHGSTVRLQSPGAGEARTLPASSAPKALEEEFTNAASQARQSDPVSFLTALDSAIQSSATQPGVRLVVAAVTGPPLSSEAESRLEQLVDICRARAVRVILLDIVPDGSKLKVSAALENLARRSGGLVIRQGNKLDDNLGVLAPESQQAETATTAAAPEPASDSYPIPVFARFLRTSPSGAASGGVDAHLYNSSQNTGAMLTERAFEANDYIGTTFGMVMVESPFSALRFDTTTIPGQYLAKARLKVEAVDSKGRVIWSGAKEYDIRGSLDRLERRRAGTLVFLRSLTLPGGDSYGLRASLRDLIAESEGRFHGPIRPSRGVPGLNASDAVFVRKFQSASDKFEADQIFAYDGDALTPRLHPVFDAGAPVDLQVFFTLYPDTYGVQPELSMEIRRDGKTVTRIPLAFTEKLRDMSREGKSNTSSGTGSNIIGGVSRQFPYLARIKGAKLMPGDYEAVVSIRQGRNVITRSASFLVQGQAPAEVAGGGTSPAPVADDSADVALPELTAVTLETGGAALAADEQLRLWKAAGDSAASYTQRLPNFRCTQEVQRFRSPIKAQDQIKLSDSYKDEIVYEDGHESYRTVEVNGEKVEAKPSKGVHSRGEFGSMLLGLFAPETGAKYKWAGRAMAMGSLCQVFEIEVDAAHTNFSLAHLDERVRVAYTGRLFIDEDTGLVRRLTIEGRDLPKKFALQSPSFSLEYGLVRIGKEDFLLPLRSVMQLRQLKFFVRNETVFGNYRRFEASSDVKFEEPEKNR